MPRRRGIHTDRSREKVDSASPRGSVDIQIGMVSPCQEVMPAFLIKANFETLADFRYQIRKFVRLSEQLALRHGIKPQQYLLLLQIKGYPGRDWATVGELAERLQAQPHGVVALISRCEKLGFVERRRSLEDRRRIEIRLLKKSHRLLDKLARLHRAELLSLQGRFVVPNIRTFEH